MTTTERKPLMAKICDTSNKVLFIGYIGACINKRKEIDSFPFRLKIVEVKRPPKNFKNLI